MSQQYQNLARRFRPQRFGDVIGQDRIVTTLQNALKSDKVSHAYLFCGSRGSGKTTLARIFAKALNCTHNDHFEPCNQCKSCKEITSGSSLDVIEIDGASNRGIDDIRHINETSQYSPSNSGYKIYIIDEVHMLTKEAFNALLKTLEEPPARVKFFFATTEPHKVLPTIISRCQRFDLSRIGKEDVSQKLQMICKEVQRDVEVKALELIANFSDGSLRDAESFLDQVLCFSDSSITESMCAKALGIITKDELHALDSAVKNHDLSFAFSFTAALYDQGKDLAHFLEELTTHFRNHLSAKLLSKAYSEMTAIYNQEQLLFILDLLTNEKAISKTSLKRVHLEMLLLKIIRSSKRISAESLIQRLMELENSTPAEPEIAPQAESLPPQEEKVEEPKVNTPPPQEPKLEIPPAQVTTPQESKLEIPPTQVAIPQEPKVDTPPATIAPLQGQKLENLPPQEKKAENPAPQEKTENGKIPFCLAPHIKPNVEVLRNKIAPKSKAQYDTLFRFSAAVLEGSLKYN